MSKPAPKPKSKSSSTVLPGGLPHVGIVMGSKSDMPAMEKAAAELTERGILHEVSVMSAHRDPELVADYAKNARIRGLRVIIAGAGLSAALPGVVAAHTDLPVIGVPLTSKTSIAGGLDALLSIAQMPPGVPVACVGVDNARNAAVLAARILAAYAFAAADVALGRTRARPAWYVAPEAATPARRCRTRSGSRAPGCRTRRWRPAGRAR